MGTRQVDGRQRDLNAILDTIECLHAGAPAPRVLLARFYALVFLVLEFALIPADWGPARFIAAVAVGWGALRFLEKHGPGRASWWTRLSDQLWSYDPIDRQALETLRRELVENARQGKRRALVRVTRWARSELAAIGGATDRAEAR